MGDIFFPHLNLKINQLNRVAFEILGFKIYWYGIFIAIGAILGLTLCLKEAKRTNQSQDLYSDFAFFSIILGVCGARIYYLIFHGDSLLEFFKFRNGGLAIYGGIIGGLLSAIIFSIYKKINFFKLLDTCSMSVLIGQIFGRWGNFFNREAFGSYTDNLFAMAIKADTVVGLKITGDTAIYQGNATYPITIYNNIKYIQVHPTFLYECLWNIILFIFMFNFRKHTKYNGQMVAIYFIGYGIGRFFIESLRTDQLLIFNVPVSMVVSALLVVLGLALLFFSKFLKKFEKTSWQI